MTKYINHNASYLRVDYFIFISSYRTLSFGHIMIVSTVKCQQILYLHYLYSFIIEMYQCASISSSKIVLILIFPFKVFKRSSEISPFLSPYLKDTSKNIFTMLNPIHTFLESFCTPFVYHYYCYCITHKIVRIYGVHKCLYYFTLSLFSNTMWPFTRITLPLEGGNKQAKATQHR